EAASRWTDAVPAARRLTPPRERHPGPGHGGAQRGGMTRAGATAAISVLLVVVGAVLIAETALVGGGIGFLFGALFVLAGALRLYLSVSPKARRSRHSNH